MKLWNAESEFVGLGSSPEISASNLGLVPLLKRALMSDDQHVTEISASGNVDKDVDYFINKIQSKGFRLVWKLVIDNNKSYVFTTEDAVIGFTWRKETDSPHLYLSGAATNDSSILELEKEFKKVVLPTVRRGHVFAIVTQNGRLSLSSIGCAGIGLHKLNYNPKVLSDYAEAIKDLKSPSPSGRIVILEGEPGTGKTHLIRSLLLDVPSAMFVMVSPDMVSMLAGPELLPLLLTTKNNYGITSSIVLVLEDADRCLVTRQGDNINSIQSLLNLGDGILGSMLDLRIVATTNAKKLEMEAALLRPGRLSKRIEVGPLLPERAQNLFYSLCPGNKDFPQILEKKVTLAEVYAIARQYGWEPQPKEDNEG